jgi:hypothetical protein
VKIAVKVVSLEADALAGGAMLSGKPYVVVEGDDNSRESCLGEWCRSENRWLFGEELSFDATRKEKLTISAYAKQEVSIWRVELSWAGPLALGSTGLDLGLHVFPNLLPEDRDEDGMVYATPNLVLTLHDAVNHLPCGRLTLRVETNAAPRTKPYALPVACCGEEDEEEPASYPLLRSFGSDAMRSSTCPVSCP